MSKLAQKLAAAPASVERPARRGPHGPCGPIYDADVEDAEEIDRFRHRQGESWATAQRAWDALLGIEASQRITNDKFRYHWRRRCYCWPNELRRS